MRKSDCSKDCKTKGRAAILETCIFYKRKKCASMSGSTAAAYGRAKALDQQDLGHYIYYKEYYHAQPLIFKCE